jgi:hypothetical protein
LLLPAQRFAAGIDDGLDFSAVTYQEVFTELRGGPELASGYFRYLEARYFAA